MAQYKQDHSRRIDGDIIITRKEAFFDLGDAVKCHWSVFTAHHHSLVNATQVRGRALVALEQAREVRDALGEQLKVDYQWGFHNTLWPDFADRNSPDLPSDKVRAALFPGGNPTRAGRSRQWLIDAVDAVVDTIESGVAADRPPSCLPKEWCVKMRTTLDAYRRSIDAVRIAYDAYNALAVDVGIARSTWDRSHRLLTELTRFSLAETSEIHRLPTLIPPAVSPAAATEELVDAPTVSDEEVLVGTVVAPGEEADPFVDLSDLLTVEEAA